MEITFDFIELLGGWILQLIFKKPKDYFTDKFPLLCIFLGIVIIVLIFLLFYGLKIFSKQMYPDQNPYPVEA